MPDDHSAFPALTLTAEGVAVEGLAASAPMISRGMSLKTLAQIAAEAGVRSLAVRISVEQLPFTQMPAVAHLEGNHYVTLHEVRRDSVVIADPADGVRVESFELFRRRWSRHLLLLHAA